MESEDSQDANSRDCASSGSSSSYEDDGPASPNPNSRPESRGSEGPDSPNGRTGSLDKPDSPSDNSIERPDSWNAQNENSCDGPASPVDSINNANQPKSPYSSGNEINSPDGPMSPKSDNEDDPEPASLDCSAKSPKSNQSSPRRSRSNSSRRSESNSPRRSVSNASRRSRSNTSKRSASNSPLRSVSNSPVRSRSNSPIESRSNSPKEMRSSSLRSQSNSPARSRSNSPERSRSNSPRRSRSITPKSVKSSRSGNRSRNANSESSSSSNDSSRSRSRPPEPPMEEISDCDMDSDHNSVNEDNSYSNQKSVSSPASNKSNSKVTDNNLNMSHEDLSDVSDLDSTAQSDAEELKPSKSPVQAPHVTDLRQKLDEAKKQNNVAEKSVSSPEEPKQQSVPLTIHKTTEDAEEALDFEAEEGECPGEPPQAETNGKTAENDKNDEEDNGEIEEGEELEEGEVTDGEENRPEETEPRPVCRFFARGQCTWGISCRFLHPGVTDKGNYTMFDMVRPVAAGPAGGHAPGFGMHHDFRTERPVHMFGPPAGGRPGGVAGEPPAVESAWERGLRTAKEMMRKANKRKEQDMDFEEKKMNLTIGQEEIERENGYYARAASPPRALSPDLAYLKPRHVPHDGLIPRKEEYFRRHYDEPRLIRMEPPIYDDLALHERDRMPRYRELPSHRMPQYEEDELLPPDVVKRRPRPAREVIVQRAEPVTRGDEWADPWMRSKSPGSRRPKERTSRRSYSSGSSYSSSSSTSSTKSRSPRSRSPRVRGTHHSSTSRRRARVSPSVIVSERRAASERALLMNPPAPSPRKRPHSPAMMRRHAQNPPAPISVSKSSSNSKSSKINREQTDAFGRVRRDIDRVSERSRRDSLTSSSKGSHKSPYKRDSRDSRRRDGRSASSNSGSSDSSSSDSGSSYSSSSSSRERSPVTSRRLVDSARLHATIDRSKVRARTPVDRKRDESRKAVESGRKRPASSPPSEDKSNKSPNGPKKASRREELLKQLKAVEDAIARKRSKND